MSETQKLQPSSEFEIPLADIQGSPPPDDDEIPLGDISEPETPQKESVPYVAGQPLPRLWKAEPDPDEESRADHRRNAIRRKARRVSPSPPASKSPSKPTVGRSKTAKPKPKKKKSEDDGDERREAGPAGGDARLRHDRVAAAGSPDHGRADGVLRRDLRLDRQRHALLGLGRTRRDRGRDAGRRSRPRCPGRHPRASPRRATCSTGARDTRGASRPSTPWRAPAGRLGLQGDAGGRRRPRPRSTDPARACRCFPTDPTSWRSTRRPRRTLHRDRRRLAAPARTHVAPATGPATLARAGSGPTGRSGQSGAADRIAREASRRTADAAPRAPIRAWPAPAVAGSAPSPAANVATDPAGPDPQDPSRPARPAAMPARSDCRRRRPRRRVAVGGGRPRRLSRRPSPASAGQPPPPGPGDAVVLIPGTTPVTAAAMPPAGPNGNAGAARR